MTQLEEMLLENLRLIDSEYRRRDQELETRLKNLIAKLNDTDERVIGLTKLLRELEAQLRSSTQNQNRPPHSG